MKTKTKPRRLDFTKGPDLEAIVLAQLCRSNDYISQVTGLTDCQISYRLSEGKKAEGYEKFHTYRSGWRNGTSRIAQQIERQFSPICREQSREVLPEKLKRMREAFKS